MAFSARALEFECHVAHAQEQKYYWLKSTPPLTFPSAATFSQDRLTGTD